MMGLIIEGDRANGTESSMWDLSETCHEGRSIKTVQCARQGLGEKVHCDAVSQFNTKHE